jgi:predicted DNA-binding protein YlxM (UPF0122 family)
MSAITDRQREVYETYLRNNKNVTDTAEELDTSQPNVSYHVNTVETKIREVAQFTQEMAEIEEKTRDEEETELEITADWI